MKKRNFKIIFLGTPDFGAIILEGLVKNNFKPILAVTAPDKPAGRKQILSPPPVKTIARKYNISVLQTEKIGRHKEEIKSLKPDLIISAGYGKIIPREILNVPQYGSLNIHPSLLPKYRGPSPIQSALLDGLRQTGITIFKMDEKIDHGPIVCSKTIKISAKDTFDTLQQRIAKAAVPLLLETIPKYANKEIKPKKQSQRYASYSKIIKKEDGKINWNSEAKHIERKTRAFFPWPGTFTFWQKNDKTMARIKILEAELSREKKDEKKSPPGKVFLCLGQEPKVKCKKNSLVLKKIQIEGKKPVSGKDFLQGNPDFLGAILK